MKKLFFLALVFTGCTLPAPTIYIDTIAPVVVTNVVVTDYPGVHEDVVHISLKNLKSGIITEYRTNRDNAMTFSLGDTINYAQTHSACRGK